MDKKKIAVILFNLGGPDISENVKPFLFNLFNDPAIIGLPNPFRWMLAKLISSKREQEAQEIYHHIGGGSPILPLTKEQAHALDAALNTSSNHEYKSFIAMRYWHPMSPETVEKVKEYAPDEVLLLPLYPHFSTTTSGSSIEDWYKSAKKAGLNVPTKSLCCYPLDEGVIDAHAKLLREYYPKAVDHGKARVLFSAHGLPKKIIEKGDPYQWQIEQTAQKIVDKLAIDGLDWKVCYQSKVGPLEWIGPATDAEILRAAKEGISVVIVPIAFVSEHSETLVELDIQYKEMAEKAGMANYTRVPALATHPDFISGLATMCQQAETQNSTGNIPPGGTRICPKKFTECMCG